MGSDTRTISAHKQEGGSGQQDERGRAKSNLCRIAGINDDMAIIRLETWEWECVICMCLILILDWIQEKTIDEDIGVFGGSGFFLESTSTAECMSVRM